MGIAEPVFFGEKVDQVALHLDGVFFDGQAEAAADAEDVGVDDYAGRHAEGGAEDAVGRLATDAW